MHGETNGTIIPHEMTMQVLKGMCLSIITVSVQFFFRFLWDVEDEKSLLWLYVDLLIMLVIVTGVQRGVT